MNADQHVYAQRIARKLNVALLKPALPTGYFVEPVLVMRQPASVKAPARGHLRRSAQHRKRVAAERGSRESDHRAPQRLHHTEVALRDTLRAVIRGQQAKGLKHSERKAVAQPGGAAAGQ
jgi:hypothetical protein